MQYTKPNIKILTDSDINALVRLYRTNGKDYRWANRFALTDAIKSGTVFGLFEKSTLLGAWPCVPYYSANECAYFLNRFDTNKVYQKYIISPISTKAVYTNFFVKEMLKNTQENALICVPIISGQHIAKAMLLKGAHIIALRPLSDLRPHYIFKNVFIKANVTNRIMVPWANTRAISKLLEHGNICTGYENGFAIITSI